MKCRVNATPIWLLIGFEWGKPKFKKKKKKKRVVIVLNVKHFE